MKQRLLKVIKIGAVIFAVGCAYALFVMKTGVTIPCMVNLITGLKCPGCGITHMAVNIMRLHFKEAFRCNPAIFVMLPVFAYLAAAKLYRYIKFDSKKEPTAEKVIEITLIIALVAFGIVRNLVSIL